ncbi:DNA-binding transcriptional regulator, LysR family [Enhydrobacter aerosaccus]|uniref:DNA-binding transcriptional regulator, LysR family n=1 Tax=Enhydrobacter aerosaccus TaxID=225324 RepID=A0A1T4MQ49_9HYPH|nr:LysR family transcriptional regulator [Enhydrobacter aerosaccus]SJZ68967.1 DNA-binding transcriptional regulator, LysR family [Enhydrobacter aerosaccus]
MHAAVLRYFDHVARHGSIRKAADALSIASSAVNRQILRLEDEMGVALFERGRSGVRPTPAGELLLRHVRETQNEYQRTRAEIASLGGIVSGDVRIISLESLLVRFLPQLVEEMAAKHPKVTFTVLSVHPSEISEALRSGDNDFGVLFVDNRHRGVDVVAEFPTAVGALMRPDHPLARHKSLTLTECVGYPVVMLQDRWLLDAIMATEFADSGARLTPRIVSNSIEFMRQVIKSGLGIGFFTPIGFLEEIRRGELIHVPLAEPGLAQSRIGILVPRYRRLSMPARLMIDHISEQLRAFGSVLAAPRPAAKRRAARGRRR